MTFTEVYNAWKAEKVGNLKPTSYSTYVLLVEKHMMPYIGGKGPVTEEDVTSIQGRVLENGGTEKTAHDVVNLLMGIIRFAARNGWWPTPNWKIDHKASEPRMEFRLLTAQEQYAILDYIRTDRTSRNIGIYIAATTGISLGELGNLTWQDIDIPNRVLHVRGIVSQFYKIDDEGSGRVWSTQQDLDAAKRDIPLSLSQVQFLKEEEGRHLPELFIMSNDTVPVSGRVIREHFKSLCKKLGIKGAQFKDLRHSFAVRCLEAGCNYSTLAVLLGNATVSRMVLFYDKYVKKEPRKYIGLAMEKILEGKEEELPDKNL